MYSNTLIKNNSIYKKCDLLYKTTLRNSVPANGTSPPTPNTRFPIIFSI